MAVERVRISIASIHCIVLIFSLLIANDSFGWLTVDAGAANVTVVNGQRWTGTLMVSTGVIAYLGPNIAVTQYYCYGVGGSFITSGVMQDGLIMAGLSSCGVSGFSVSTAVVTLPAGWSVFGTVDIVYVHITHRPLSTITGG